MLTHFVRTREHPWRPIVNSPFIDTLRLRREKRGFFRILYGISRRMHIHWLLRELIDENFALGTKVMKTGRGRIIVDFHRSSNIEADERYDLNLQKYKYY